MPLVRDIEARFDSFREAAGSRPHAILGTQVGTSEPLGTTKDIILFVTFFTDRSGAEPN